MTLAQKGAYITLLCLQFNKGFLELEDIENVIGRDFEAVWPKIKGKFVEIESGIFRNEFMHETREDRLRLSKTRSEVGKTGGRPKAEKELKEKQNPKQKKTNSFVLGDSNSNRDKTMDETIKENLVIPMKDDTKISLSPKPKSGDPNLIEREFKVLFVQHFDQKGKLNPSRNEFVAVVLSLESRGMSRAEACSLILEQGRKYAVCCELENKDRRFIDNCENWLEKGEWQKDYDAMAASIQKSKAVASASPVQAQLNKLSGGQKL